MKATRDRRRIALQILCLALGAASLAGCEFLGGAAVGAAGTGAAYEYEHKQALDRLDRQFDQGEISREEYLARKKEIERGSLVY